MSPSRAPRAERIAVTGLGMISALGASAQAVFEAVLAGRRGIGPIELFDASGQRCEIAAEVSDLRVEDVAPRGEAHDWSRTDALAALAAEQAVQSAGLSPADFRGQGLSMGGTAGSMFETESALATLELSSLSRERAERLLLYPLSATVERLSRVVAPFGCASTICSACSSGAIALVQGAAWLRSGRVERVLAGGADGLCRLTLAGFNALGATDPAPCRPFDRARAGLNLGEGAAFLVLERESTALARGATVLAWLSGWAVGAEAHHITHPEASGRRASELMQRALRVAGLDVSDVDYVSAHGTGTTQNDAMEAIALERVFEGAVSRVAVSSQKAQIGHTLGAAGALEAAITVLALERSRVPPAVGLEDPERPELGHVRELGVIRELGAALSNSFGFGGMGCVLAFENRNRPHRGEPLTAPVRVVVSGIAAAGPLGATRGAESAVYASGTAVPASELTFDPLAALDPNRSRRFDRACALVTWLTEAALGDAKLGEPDTGLVVGNAFGNVERTMRFLERIAARGARHATPAEFPHLVASAAAGNCSIYARLEGPVFSVGDLALSAEAALHSALELIELGVAERITAGAAEALDPIVRQVMGSTSPEDPSVPRSEGGAFVVFERLESARARGVTPLAEIHLARRFLNDPDPGVLGPPLGERALVVLCGAGAQVLALLDASFWAGVPRVSVLPSSGYHEAAGAVALAAALGSLATGRADDVLVATGGREGVSIVQLRRPEP